jgi:hypothetical protein
VRTSRWSSGGTTRWVVEGRTSFVIRCWQLFLQSGQVPFVEERMNCESGGEKNIQGIDA